MQSFVLGIVRTQLFLFIVLVISFETYAQEINRNNGISLICNQKTLRSVLEEIKNQAGVSIIYDDCLIDDLIVSCCIKNSKVENAICKVLKYFNIAYKMFSPDVYVLYKKKKAGVTSYTTVLEQQPIFNIDTNVVIIEPKKISKSIPIYPPEAERNKIEGKVTIKILINENGKVMESLVDKSSGFGILDSSAVNYSSGLKFVPAKANDKSIPIWLSILFEYKIINKN